MNGPGPAAMPLLGEMLLEMGGISASDLELALRTQQARGGRLGILLVKMGAITEDTLYPILATQLGLPLVRLVPGDEGNCRAALDEIGPASSAALLRCEVLPWRSRTGELQLVTHDPIASQAREVVHGLPGVQEAAWALGFPHEVRQTIEAVRSQPAEAQVLDSRALREMADDAPIIALVNGLVAQAVESRASDIHLEPFEQDFEVRFRVDGVMQVRQAIPMSRYAAVSSRIKLIAGIDIAERRLPQDGRISTRAAGSDIEIRVSTVPAVHGESIVMRLLPKQRTDLSLEGLGMEPTQLASFKRWLDLPNGLVLVTGPTGAGKSTTLYAALAATNDRTRKIITVEDPVEYQLEHVVQVQAQPEIGYTFARALRAFLRHDPDVIMVGEIRDRETAEIAIQSALTGHLVLSTLHTNDAPSAVTRLIDMGIEPFLVAASLRAVMAQRLARRLCDHCASPSPAQSPDSRVWGSLVAGAALASTAQAETNARFRASSGCAKCQGTGFRGRLGIYSLLTIEQDIQRAILEGAPATRLGQIASAHGFRTLAQEGWLKVCQGVTTADEVVRAIGASD